MRRATNRVFWRNSGCNTEAGIVPMRRRRKSQGRCGRSLAFESLENRSVLSATVASLGTAAGDVASGNLALGAATAVAAGNTVIVEIAANPSATPTVADVRGNVYTQVAHAVSTGNVETWIFSAPVRTALAAGDFLNVHFEATAPVAEVVSALSVSGLTPPGTPDQVQSTSGAGTIADSGLTATTSQANEFLIGAIGVEGPSTDGFTPGSGYTLVGRAGVNATPSVTINPEFRSVTTAGQYNATGTLAVSRAWAAAIATFAEETPNEQFISHVYLDFLNRSVDASGLAYWSSQLAAGQSRQQVVFQIEQTPEYANVTVEQLYQRYLHRPADPSGLSSFSSQLLAGERIEQVAAEIAGSQEFYTTQGGGTNDGFLNALYQDALGRPIDPIARSFWTVQLAFGASRTSVATVVLNTQEYRHDVVTQAYQHLLDRNPDPAGSIAWQTVLNFGGTDQYVYSGIAGTQEYFEKAQG